MKSAKYLIPLLVGTLVYVALSVFCGQNGIWAMQQLEEQKRIISAHTQEIQNINDDLHLEKTAMRDDVDVIAAYARKLDYVFESEKLVKIKGLGVSEPLMYDTGTVLKSTKVKFMAEWFCKSAGAGLGLLIALLMVLYDLSYGVKSISNRRHFETIEGIPVYDVAQI